MTVGSHRLKGLDGVRGLAILSVIAYHTLLIADQPAILPTLWSAVMNSTWAGVDLFFVLSGFLITGNLIDARGQDGYFRNFYARRTLRIFPLYYGVLAVVFLAGPLAFFLARLRLPSMYSTDIANQWWLWTYLQNYLQSTGPHQLPGFGHFWSLAVEEQFYWVWPLVVFFSGNRALVRVCAGVCVLSPFLRFALLQCCLTPWAVRELTFTRADTLLFGALAAVLVRESGIASKLSRAAGALAAAAILCLAVILVRYHWLPYESPAMEVVGYSAQGILFAALIYRIAAVEGRLAHWFSNPALRWFGKYSYAVYVFQAPLSEAFKAMMRRFIPVAPLWMSVGIVFACTTAVSCAAALISWNLLERRFLRLKRYFENGAPVEAPVAALSQSAAI
jgi:peptidoglycan/LPS O-acetylase OafA/YrhL